MAVLHPNPARTSQRGGFPEEEKKSLDVLDDHAVRNIICGSPILAQDPNVFPARIHNCRRNETSELTYLAALFTTKGT